LWSSILDSVSSSRSIPSKQVLLFGQPKTGKSSIAAALLQKPVSDHAKDDEKSDFAVGYDFSDVRDEGDEDTLARLSVYTVPSSAAAYTSLLPHFLPPRPSLPHTLVMIVLDWTRPWSFVEELQTWLLWVEKWAKGDGSRELEIVREENRERRELFMYRREYGKFYVFCQFSRFGSTMPNQVQIRCRRRILPSQTLCFLWDRGR
jgi:dynein light intermediate chain 1